jgi:hypothetical protein
MIILLFLKMNNKSLIDNFLNNNFMKYKLLLITLFACGLGWGQIISQYVETNSGSTPKGIEIWNNTGSTLNFSTNNLIIQQGTNGAAVSTIVTINNGTLDSGDVIVIGTSDIGTYLTGQGLAVLFTSYSFTYNGDDALVVKYGSTTTDIFGMPGSRPSSSWLGSGVNTANQNIELISGITSGASTGWTDPSLRFSTISTSPSTLPAGLNGFGISPIVVPTSTTYTTDWSNSAPTASIDAIINGELTTTDDLVCKDLTINSGKTLTIGAGKKLTVSGNLINNGTIVFKSTATSTAMFDIFSGTLSGSGVTTVERFIPARRAYRFLSPSVTTSTTIRQNWQENGGTAAGLGTHITGIDGATNGFDPTETNNSSLLLFTNGAWVGATSTNVGLTAGNAYCLMVRGDRTTDLTTNTPATSNTVLRATGTLFTGNFSPVLSAAASGYSFVGNPYQAPLDIKTALQSSTDVNPNVIYYWDPTINARGGYITRNLQASENTPSTSSVNDYVQPGQAFFVVNEPTLTSTPALTFTENHKSVANAAAGVFRNANTSEYGTLRVNLQANTNNQWQTIEGALAIFNDNFSWNVTSEDATKIANLDEEVSFVQNNTSLAIACQSNPSRTSELPLKIERMRHSAYQWQFELDNYEGESAYLFDAINNSYTEITHGSVVPFTADANTTNRFKIVFQNSALSTDDFANHIKLYPNPAKAGGSFYVDGITEATVSVYNVVGQNIPVTVMSQGNAIQVTPTATLSQGVYLVTVTTAGKTAQVKWIVE